LQVLLQAFNCVPREVQIAGPALHDPKAYEFVLQSLQQVDQYGAEGRFGEAAALLITLKANGHIVYYN
jgi:hypothetical protein